MMEAAYRDHGKLVNYLAYRFCCRYFESQKTQHFCDCLSMAHEYFVEAVNTYDGSSPLGKRIGFSVWRRMQQTVTRERNKRKKYGVVFVSVEEEVIDNKSHNYERLIKEISEDAREVISLVLESSELPYLRKAKTKKKYLATILSNMGWTAQKIRETFQEITEALQ